METSELTTDWIREMLFEVGADNDEYFSVPEEQEPLSFRVDASLKRSLDLLIPLWRARAIATGQNPDLIDRSHVYRRLMFIAGHGALAEPLKSAGLNKLPTTADEWEKLNSSIDKLALEALPAKLRNSNSLDALKSEKKSKTKKQR